MSVLLYLWIIDYNCITYQKAVSLCRKLVIMKKKFNTTGVCFKNNHYMMDNSTKIQEIIELVEYGEYFTINRPRQYGKTTTLKAIMDSLEKKEDYLGISIDFQELNQDANTSSDAFAVLILDKIILALSDTDPDLEEFMKGLTPSIRNMSSLSKAITSLIHKAKRRVVLLIDEVDASSNYYPFLSFLAVLRSKYLKRYLKSQATFHSIILAGVHDVKTLKYRFNDGENSSKYNSPWNIAITFKVEMSFNVQEISPMLEEYSKAENVSMNVTAIAEKLYDYTSGYPFLVSALCKIIAEDIMPQKSTKDCTIDDVNMAAKLLLKQADVTNFESLTKNLEKDKDLYQLVYSMLIEGNHYSYNSYNPTIHLGVLHGVFRNGEGIRIHNKIYEQLIYNYMISKTETNLNFRDRPYARYINNGKLDVAKVLVKFQEFMKQAHDKKDKKFLERDGRLVFLAFMTPILNGGGFAFKEPQIADEKRLDVVITYGAEKHIIELKRWYGNAAHERGLEQICGYLEREQMDTGFMLIFEHNITKTWKQKWLEIGDKKVFVVWV